jgi:glycerol-3-phosphate dehydrogenase (NAD(P)+)
MSEMVGVIGGGSFGATVAKLLSENNDVLLYTRRSEIIDHLNETHTLANTQLAENVRGTNHYEEVCEKCSLIFPVVPSIAFREMMKHMSPYLFPYHILIHGTKGLDINQIKEEDLSKSTIDRHKVNTMSEVIAQETSVIRIGSMSGPNLAREILAGLPAACVIASEFDEVIKVGQDALKSNHFAVFGSHDLRGVELAGAFKNIIAIGSGICDGLQLGRNMQALLITRGLKELIEFGFALDYSGEAFLGAAGMGDMIATAFSPNSRNFTFGYRFAKGESLDHILHTSEETIEGVNTLKVIYHLSRKMKVFLPIVYTLYKTIFEDQDKLTSIHQLMSHNYAKDVDFMISKM